MNASVPLLRTSNSTRNHQLSSLQTPKVGHSRVLLEKPKLKFVSGSKENTNAPVHSAAAPDNLYAQVISTSFLKFATKG